MELSARLEPDELEGLESAVQRALREEDERELEVLGYGEISCVLGLKARGGPVACKRLPPFADARAFAAYRACFDEYLATLAAADIGVLPSKLYAAPGPGDRLVAYCVQPWLRSASLAPAQLARGGAPSRHVFVELLERSLAFVTPQHGLDAQLSNWAVLDGRPLYLDLTTPLLRDGRGRERLDVSLFLASLPWLLRGFVRRFLLGDLLEAYYTPRGVLLDVLANAIKEGLADVLDELTALARDVAGPRVQPALTAAETRAYYASDARLWALLQRLRRLDRLWQRRVRRRCYPFLLPGKIERRV